ncbi:MAG: DUF4012 domain-containing protein, partial [Acidimicrobiales bacterium]
TTGLALQAEELGAALLGGDGHARTYFLALATDAELRGSAGLIGNYGELTTDDGRLTLSRFGRIADLTTRAPQHPDGLGWDPEFVATYRGALEGSLWLGLSISPDFPTVADAIEKLYPRSGGRSVDGVIAIDPIGLAALLQVEGPITVPLWPDPLSASTIVQVLLHEEYNAFMSETTRVEFLSEVTSAVVSRVRATNVDSLTALAKALAPAVVGKHLLMASTRVDEETGLKELGVAGALPPVVDDALAVFTTNATANKIDWYLRRSITYDATVGGDAERAVLTVSLTNDAPAAGQSQAVIGTLYFPALAPGTSRLILSILTPLTGVGATVDGRRISLAVAHELGRNILSLGVDVPSGGTRLVRIELTGSRRAGDYQLDIGEQPTSTPDHFEISVRGERPTPTVRAGVLDRDTVFYVPRR